MIYQKCKNQVCDCGHHNSKLIRWLTHWEEFGEPNYMFFIELIIGSSILVGLFYLMGWRP